MRSSSYELSVSVTTHEQSQKHKDISDSELPDRLVKNGAHKSHTATSMKTEHMIHNNLRQQLINSQNQDDMKMCSVQQKKKKENSALETA